MGLKEEINAAEGSLVDMEAIDRAFEKLQTNNRNLRKALEFYAEGRHVQKNVTIGSHPLMIHGIDICLEDGLIAGKALL